MSRVVVILFAGNYEDPRQILKIRRPKSKGPKMFSLLAWFDPTGPCDPPGTMCQAPVI